MFNPSNFFSKSSLSQKPHPSNSSANVIGKENSDELEFTFDFFFEYYDWQYRYRG